MLCKVSSGDSQNHLWPFKSGDLTNTNGARSMVLPAQLGNLGVEGLRPHEFFVSNSTLLKRQY